MQTHILNSLIEGQRLGHNSHNDIRGTIVLPAKPSQKPVGTSDQTTGELPTRSHKNKFNDSRFLLPSWCPVVPQLPDYTDSSFLQSFHVFCYPGLVITDYGDSLALSENINYCFYIVTNVFLVAHHFFKMI